MIEIFRLKHVAELPAGTLSYGQQKLIDIAMAFMPSPRLVLFDEPCAGVNPSLVDQLRELLVELNRTQGGSFVVIEHNMDFIMRLCPHVICMVEGKVLSEGAAARRAVESGGARSLSWQLTAMGEKIIEFDKVVAGYSPSLTILNETTLDARARARLRC